MAVLERIDTVEKEIGILVKKLKEQVAVLDEIGKAINGVQDLVKKADK